jgi:hypothetical protein
MNIVDIGKSWLKAAASSEEEEQLALYRKAICENCPHKIEGKIFEAICDKCGCPLSKKIYSQFGCPIDKW